MVELENGEWEIFDEAGQSIGVYSDRKTAKDHLILYGNRLDRKGTVSLLRPDEMKSIEFLASRMNTHIPGDISLTFWAFPIILKISEELARLDAEIVNLKHKLINQQQELIATRARIDKLESER